MDHTVFVDMMVELAGLEEELLDLQGQKAARARRMREVALRGEIAEDSAREAEEEGRKAAAGYLGSAGELRDVEALLAHKRDQLVGLTDRRQVQALQREIAGLEKRLDHLETTALEYLEQPPVEPAATGPTPEQEAEVAELRAADEKAHLAEKEILAEIDRLVALAPAPHGKHLARLREQYPQAVVRVADRSCGGCGGQLPPQQALDAARGKAAVRCPSCARIVVRLSYR